MPEFDERIYDAMSDENLAEHLAHDAELPLSFVRNADAILYAATVLAARRSETLPDAAAALERFKEDYLPVPFDGCTLWDDPPRFAPPKTSPRTAAETKPRLPAAPPEKPKKKAAKTKAYASPPIQSKLAKPVNPPPPPHIAERAPKAAQPVPMYIPVPARPPEKPFRRAGAGLFFAALLLLLIGVGFLYIRSAMRATIGIGPSPSPSTSAGTGYTLTWVPNGYTETSFSGWDVSGYLYTWQNAAGDRISFSRHPGGENVAVNQSNAETSVVTVEGVNGEYTVKNGARALVFSDKAGANIYYLNADNVSDGDMQNMIAAIK